MNPDDSYYMRKALRLAQKGAGKTSPNPMVGTIIVLNGKEVGAGFHSGPGHPHAEVMALADAGYPAGVVPPTGVPPGLMALSDRIH